MTRHYLVGDIAYPEHNGPAVEHGKPVVVIDPEDEQAVDALTKAIVEAAERHGNVIVSGNGIHPSTTADALREFANPTPPKPEEPTGLGAVVEDADGKRYVRLRGADFVWPWATSARHEVRYADIAAVKVLSEGVTA